MRFAAEEHSGNFRQKFPVCRRRLWTAEGGSHCSGVRTSLGPALWLQPQPLSAALSTFIAFKVEILRARLHRCVAASALRGGIRAVWRHPRRVATSGRCAPGTRHGSCAASVLSLVCGSGDRRRARLRQGRSKPWSAPSVRSDLGPWCVASLLMLRGGSLPRGPLPFRRAIHLVVASFKPPAPSSQVRVGWVGRRWCGRRWR